MEKTKFPKELGACADLLFKVYERRQAAKKAVEKMAAYEVELREHILEIAKRTKATSGGGRLAKVRIDVKETPQVQDWDKFYKYLLKVKRPELLQRKLSEAAVNETLEAGEDIPGVEIFRRRVVSKPTRA